jgi:hypothetical protein
MTYGIIWDDLEQFHIAVMEKFLTNRGKKGIVFNPLAALCTYRVRSYFGIVRRTHT